MKRVSAAALIALVLMLTAAAIGLSLRSAATAINYPAYSSFNNEQLGLRAYYETARRLGIPVERNYRRLTKVAGTKGTVLYADLAPDALRHADTKDLELYERVAKPGARLLFLLNEHEAVYELLEKQTRADRQAEGSGPNKPAKDEPAEKGHDAKKTNGQKQSGEKQGNGVSQEKEPDENLRLRWGIEMKPVDTPRKAAPGIGGMLGSVDNTGRFVDRRWVFVKWDDHWKSTSGADHQVYMLERTFGEGSVVLLLGLESFTNKALLTTVDTARIAGTFNGPRPLIFDEAHLGVADDDTVAGYARHFNLQWLLLGLAVLAAFYVWRSSVSFVPALPEIHGAEIAGREAYIALASLLSQSIKQPDLAREIVAAWRESFRMLPSSKVHVTEESLESFADARDSDAPAGYAAVSRSARRKPPA